MTTPRHLSASIRVLTIASAVMIAHQGAVADVIEVPAGGNIQTAIDQATDGDVIQLAAGTYRPSGRLEITGKSLTIQGVSDPGNDLPETLIDGRLLHQHLRIAGDESQIDILNIEFRFGYGDADEPDGQGGSIALEGGRLQLDNTVFRQNIIVNGNPGIGGAIYCEPMTTLECANSRFWNNGKCCDASFYGGAIGCDEATAVLSDCDFQGNYAIVGGALHARWSDIQILRCRFIENGIKMPNSGGGGATNFQSCNVEIFDCDFLNNVGEFGGAVGFLDLCEASIRRCRFIGNGSEDCHFCRGGAINLNSDSNTLLVEDSEFSGNIASSPDIHIAGGTPCVSLLNNRFEVCCPIANTAAVIDLGNNIVEFTCSSCPGDLNCGQLFPWYPRRVDASDLGQLLNAWNTPNSICDIDGDGVVGSGDLGMLLANWGDCPE